jgi:hypothetical protein
MGFQLGLNAKMHINLYSGDIGVARGAWPASGLPLSTATNTPEIEEFTNVKNVRTNIEFGDADITTRGGGGWRQFAPTLAEASLEFESVWDPDSSQTAALFTAALDRDSVQAVALDKNTVGGQGLWADWIVSTASRTEDLEEALMIDFTMKVARGTLAPSWETVGA